MLVPPVWSERRVVLEEPGHDGREYVEHEAAHGNRASARSPWRHAEFGVSLDVFLPPAIRPLASLRGVGDPCHSRSAISNDDTPLPCALELAAVRP